jgi:hypothetical protein
MRRREAAEDVVAEHRTAAVAPISAAADMLAAERILAAGRISVAERISVAPVTSVVAEPVSAALTSVAGPR